MARTVMPVTTTARAGVVVPAATAVDAVNGNQFVNTGREVLQVTNGGASPITVTFTAQAGFSVGTATYPVTNPTGTVTNGTTKQFGPFDKGLFNDPTGNVWVDWSSGTTVTALVTSLGFQ